MAKPSQLKAARLSDPESGGGREDYTTSEAESASNIKTEPDEELEAQISSQGVIRRGAMSKGESDEDEDEEDEDEDDDEDDDIAPPPRRVFTSTILPQKNEDSDSDSSNDNEESSSSSSSSDDDSSEDSDSDSKSEDRSKKAATRPPLAKAAAKTAGPRSKAVASKAKAAGGDDSDTSDNASAASSSSASSSSSDSDSDSDSDGGDKEANIAKADPGNNDPPVPGVTAAADEVESSDDDDDDIPFSLPQGRNPDVQTEDTNEDLKTADTSEEGEAAVVPATPEEAPEPEPAPAATRATRQRSKRQVAKAPYIPDAAADTNEEAANGEPAAEEPEVPSSAKSPRKRKRATIEAPEDDNEDPETPAPRSAKKHSSMRTPASRASAGTSDGGGRSVTKGPQGNFTPDEVDTLKAAATKYMEENNVSQADFNLMVQDNAQKHSSLWNELASEFPDKKRLQVILRSRRIYHNFKQQYRWTDNEDVELADLVGRHGNKWQLIAAAMDRSSEDVRKRWEERVVCGDNVLLSYWRFEEEKTLGQVVGQVLRELQASRKQDITKIHPDTVRDIPWHTVSERMGHTRTARQCRIKWRAIQEAYHFNADGEFVGPPPPEEWSNSQAKAEKMHAQFLKYGSSTPARSARSTPLRAPGTAKTPADKAGSSGKTPKTNEPLLGIGSQEDGTTVPETGRLITDRTRKQVRAMSNEDKYRLVLSIRDSNVGRLDKIPWTRLVDVSFRKKYERAARELVWGRLRRSVPNHNRKSVRQVCDYLIKEYDADDKVGQAWDLDFDDEPEGGDDNAPAIRSTSAVAKAVAAAKGRRAATNGTRSGEFVAESDGHQSDNDAGSGDESSIEEAAEMLTRRRARGGAKTAKANGPVNGDAGNHVSESEAEEEARHSRATRATRATASQAKGRGAEATRGQRLLHPYLDFDGASTPSNSQQQTQENDVDGVDDIDDDDEDGAGRRDREASVDLSMAEKLSSAHADEDGAAQDESEPDPDREPQPELPLTLSLSPGLAHNRPTARNRPLPMLKQRRDGNNLETESPSADRPARASRFQQVADTSATSLTALRPSDVRRKTKRSLNSAQWQLDGGDEEGVADDIEVSDTDKAGYGGFSSITGMVKNAFMSRKRPRQDSGW